MTQFAINLLGTFQVRVNKQSVTNFHSDKARALLAYLALEPKEHARSQLAALLWPEIGETYARTNLRNTLHRLRHTLNTATPDGANQLLHVTRRSIQFIGGKRAVDALRLQALLESASTATTARLDQLTKAAELYQGELLAGFAVADAPPFEEWLLLRRELLHQQILLALQRLATEYESSGDNEQAYETAKRLLTFEPYREEVSRLVMRLLVRLGKSDQALQVAEQLRQRLHSELGVQPSTATLALAEQIAAGAHEGMQRRQDLKPVVGAERVATSLPALALREVPDPGFFFGRKSERQQIIRWLLHEHCRIVTILGIGGIGKTSLVAQSVRELVQRAHGTRIDLVLWRSLVNAPPLSELLPPLLQILSDQQLRNVPTTLDDQLRLLLGYLQNKHVLLVLDNLESILEAERAGVYRPGYEPYEQLIQQMATHAHQSHLLLTSREQSRSYTRFEKDGLPVRSLMLTGLDDHASHELIRQRGLVGHDDEEEILIARYAGNPLALKLVADTVVEIFDGDLNEFLTEETPVFDDVQDILDQQFARLTDLEQEILFWLAVEREALPLSSLRKNFLEQPSQRALVEALRSLQRRSLIQHDEAGFGLQNVIIEYLTNRLAVEASHEIASANFDRLHRQALLKAQAKVYVRESQARLILNPIGERLLGMFGRRGLLPHIQNLLNHLHRERAGMPSYVGGNLLNLLLHLEIDVRGLDLSQLSVWQAYLAGTTLVNVNFARADLARSVFTNTFNRVKAIAMSPTSKLLALGTDHGGIRLWRLADGQLLRILQGHSGLVVSLAFSPDGCRLVSCSQLERTIFIWDVDSGRVLHTLHGHHSGMLTVAFSPDGELIAAGDEKQTIYLWNSWSGELLGTQRTPDEWVQSLVFHPNSDILASCSRSHSGYFLWRIAYANGHKTEDEIYHLIDQVPGPGDDGGIYALAFSPDGSLLAGGGTNHSIYLWDVQTGDIVKTLRGHANFIRALAFSPDGKVLASGSNDFSVRLWDVAHGQVLDILRYHTHQLWAVVISGDGEVMASGGSDGMVCLWDLGSSQHIRLNRVLDGYTEPIYALALSPDGKRLATGESNGVVRIRDVEHLPGPIQAEKTLIGHEALVDDVAFSPNGRWLASACQDQTVRLWDIDAGKNMDTLHAPGSDGIHVTFHPSSNLMAYSAGIEIYLRDLTSLGTEQQMLSLKGHANFVHHLHFSPNGEFLASCGGDDTVRLWELATHECLHVFDKVGKDFWSLSYSPSGRFLAGAGRDGIFIWDMHTPSFPLRPFHAMARMTSVRVIAFSPQGNRLVSSGSDRLVRIWDIGTGQELHQLSGHSADVTSIAFTPDGEAVLTGSYDGTIRLWHVDSGECLDIIRKPGPYEGMNISGITGITEAQRAALKTLGAVEN